MEVERSAFYYTGFRSDLVKLIPPETERLLSVGCGAGHTEAYLKQEMGLREVVAVEINAEVVGALGELIDAVLIGDIQQLELPYPCKHFDCILYPDVLEHLVDPWVVLARHRRILSDEGIIIASVPNVRYYYILLWLLFGDWPYSNRGILDMSHLRFFTLRSFTRMLAETGYSICTVHRKYRLVDALGDHLVLKIIKKALDRINKALSRIGFFDILIGLREFFVFQYLVVAKKAE